MKLDMVKTYYLLAKLPRKKVLRNPAFSRVQGCSDLAQLVCLQQCLHTRLHRPEGIAVGRTPSSGYHCFFCTIFSRELFTCADNCSCVSCHNWVPLGIVSGVAVKYVSSLLPRFGHLICFVSFLFGITRVLAFHYTSC